MRGRETGGGGGGTDRGKREWFEKHKEIQTCTTEGVRGVSY